MVAKIGHGMNIMGALLYNFLKIENGKGSILHTQKIRETPQGSYTAREAFRSFEPYLFANRNTEKPALHISLLSALKRCTVAGYISEEPSINDTFYTNARRFDRPGISAV